MACNVSALQRERSGIFRSSVCREFAKGVVALRQEGEVGIAQVADVVLARAEEEGHVLQEGQRGIVREPGGARQAVGSWSVSYTHLRAHETGAYL
eukprot:1249322-Pyramimonas_sp.AAC.2